MVGTWLNSRRTSEPRWSTILTRDFKCSTSRIVPIRSIRAEIVRMASCCAKPALKRLALPASSARIQSFVSSSVKGSIFEVILIMTALTRPANVVQNALVTIGVAPLLGFPQASQGKSLDRSNATCILLQLCSRDQPVP